MNLQEFLTQHAGKKISITATPIDGQMLALELTTAGKAPETHQCVLSANAIATIGSNTVFQLQKAAGK